MWVACFSNRLTDVQMIEGAAGYQAGAGLGAQLATLAAHVLGMSIPANQPLMEV